MGQQGVLLIKITPVKVQQKHNTPPRAVYKSILIPYFSIIFWQLTAILIIILTMMSTLQKQNFSYSTETLFYRTQSQQLIHLVFLFNCSYDTVRYCFTILKHKEDLFDREFTGPTVKSLALGLRSSVNFEQRGTGNQARKGRGTKAFCP